LAGEELVGTLLRDPGSFPPETPEVIELGPAHPASADDLDALYSGGMERENTLDSDSGGNLPDHEGLSYATTPPTDADPLKSLDPLFLPFTDAVKNPDRIPGSELGDVLAKLFLLELSQQIRHYSPQLVRVDRNK
jgi:hypothetical protein